MLTKSATAFASILSISRISSMSSDSFVAFSLAFQMFSPPLISPEPVPDTASTPIGIAAAPAVATVAKPPAIVNSPPTRPKPDAEMFSLPIKIKLIGVVNFETLLISRHLQICPNLIIQKVTSIKILIK